MRHPGHGLEHIGERSERRDRAISALVFLGGKIRSLYARGTDGTDAATGLPAEAADTLLRAIEGEIVPRLMLLHDDDVRAAEPPVPARPVALDDADHARFLDHVMRDSATSTRDFVDALLRRGVPRDVVFLELLGGAARRLGELWEEDRADFAEVTIGLCRLHEVLREKSVLHDTAHGHAAMDGPSILLATACADQHVFGVVMVAEFFRQDAWRVWSEPGATTGQIAASLARDRFDVVGLSATKDVDPDAMGSEIATYRKASRNTALRVLVGGRLFLETPELVADVGADALAEDARGAPSAARSLLSGREVRHP